MKQWLRAALGAVVLGLGVLPLLAGCAPKAESLPPPVISQPGQPAGLGDKPEGAKPAPPGQ